MDAVNETQSGLAGTLKTIIRTNGPMNIAAWMAHCLADPERGYYRSGEPIGAAGDFITAPEVSQMFGEIVGAWLIDLWQQQGSPKRLNLVELGPGRGTLMADILRVAKLDADFSAAVSVHMVETGTALRKAQEAALAPFSCPKDWHESLASVPDGPFYLIANEFFDALPVRQFVRQDGSWAERMIGLDAAGDFTFGFGPGRPERAPEGAAHGDVFEERPAALPVMDALSSRIARNGGAALIVDYGHAETGFGDTLQAVSHHRYADPLKDPGEVDLTAHVDFAALADAAEAGGAAVHGPMCQGEFLLRLGLGERAERLGFGRSEAEQAALRSDVIRLASPDEMGTLFKVLAVTPPGLQPPPFHEGS
ncbi:class I SAM-dependent methyltransferase [Afifella sp. IM 167]|uniref:class I SAM-dependent methyltransferase n=1 Tax=Afifella sp. IM 167 TaxID=2033586 RepID=UPI001CCACAFA|nr:SAM-dependent methyltransferase [Afifella sp. IM 167]MBZ8134885.1 methyltransferase [Afifella sp. IM 167]